jgi:DNA-binding protein HU-beta
LGKEEPLNRKELVDAIQKHTMVSRTDVDKVLGSLIQHTQVAVKKGDRVSLVGFGTFERQDRKARTARNPRSGAPVKVKATKVPRFRAGQGFKDVVSGRSTAPKLTPVKSTAKASTAKASIEGQQRQGLDVQGLQLEGGRLPEQHRQGHGQGRLARQGQERQEEVAPATRPRPRRSGASVVPGWFSRGRAGSGC